MAARDTVPDIASALALLTGARLIAALATLLLALAPRKLRNEEPELSAEVADRVARDVAALGAPDAFDGERIRRDAARDALQYRAEYAAAALSRLTSAVASAERGKRREALSRAYRVERRYLDSHREVSEQRMKAADTAAAMAAQHGSVLVWKHQLMRQVQEARPSHKAADGRSWDLMRGLPPTGAMPGSLPGCSCGWVPAVGGEPEMS